MFDNNQIVNLVKKVKFEWPENGVVLYLLITTWVRMITPFSPIDWVGASAVVDTNIRQIQNYFLERCYCFFCRELLYTHERMSLNRIHSFLSLFFTKLILPKYISHYHTQFLSADKFHFEIRIPALDLVAECLCDKNYTKTKKSLRPRVRASTNRKLNGFKLHLIL